MPRRKPAPSVVLADLDAVDATLAEIAEIERQLETVDARMNRVIARAKEKAKVDSARLRAKREELGQAMTAFAVATKAAYFGKKKSLELLHGVCGFRRSSKLATLKGWTWEKVLSALHGMATSVEDWLTYGGCIRTTYSVDKDAVKKLSPEEMARVGCTVSGEDEFFYELKKESAAERAA